MCSSRRRYPTIGKYTQIINQSLPNAQKQTESTITTKTRMIPNLRQKEIEMNVVPRVHSLLIITCKLVDNDYVIVLDKSPPVQDSANEILNLLPRV